MIRGPLRIDLNANDTPERLKEAHPVPDRRQHSYPIASTVAGIRRLADQGGRSSILSGEAVGESGVDQVERIGTV